MTIIYRSIVLFINFVGRDMHILQYLVLFSTVFFFLELISELVMILYLDSDSNNAFVTYQVQNSPGSCDGS